MSMRAWRENNKAAELEISKRHRDKRRAELQKLRTDSEELRKLREAGMLAPQRAKDVGGRPQGMTPERQKKARELLRYIEEFIDKQGHDDGSIPHAAVKAYPGIARGTAIERAKKTLKDYRKFVGGQKPPA